MRSPADTLAEERDRLFEWIRSDPSAYISDAVDLAIFAQADGGRGLRACRAIARDELLFRLPSTKLLSSKTSSLAQEIDLEGFRRDAGDWMCLILVIMYEIGRGSMSPFSPYLDVLPRTFETPMFWNAGEILDLQASSLVQKIGRQDAEDAFARFIKPIAMRHPNVFSLETITLAHYHRAGSLIQAYAFDLQSDESPSTRIDEDIGDDADGCDDYDDDLSLKTMVPLADMLNGHSQKNNARIFHGSAPEMRAVKNIRCGDQIFNTYGHLPDADLLRRYGYVLGHRANPDNTVEIESKLLLKVVSVNANQTLTGNEQLARIDYLLDAGVLDDSFELRAAEAPGADIVPDEISIVFVMLGLSEEDFARHRRAGTLAKASRTATTKALVLKLLSTKLQDYATSLSEDRLLLLRASLRNRERLAIEVRAGEKVILSEAIEQVSAWPSKRSVECHAQGD
ncbi:Ribosomal lysine N-methyltransferase 4 [Savitreella phatthalungensis]